MINQTLGLWEQILDSEAKELNRSYNENSQGESPLTFIDLFAGIGGFHLAMHSVGAKCVFASEWDQYARQTYEANYRKLAPELFSRGLFAGDITKVDPASIPPFDILCAGFPCQPFSVAGLRRGFEDTRGTLFFNIANIVKSKIEEGNPPKVLFLENVRGLRTHDKGNTLRVILDTLEELGYRYSYEVLNAKYFGVPQNRERLFIVAWSKDLISADRFLFPYGIDAEGNTIYDKQMAKRCAIQTKVSDIFEPQSIERDEFTISDRMWFGHQTRKKRNRLNGKGFGYSKFTGNSIYTSTISARYWKDGSEILIDQSNRGLNPRMLTPVEAGRLQGYKVIGSGWEHTESASNLAYSESDPEFKIVVSKKEAYRQFGNSVAIPVIKRLSQEIIKQLIRQ
ncbi:DNA (cytosine-5-)-methyltransferase [uncultured Porphyromonas sp.]|uniref:DNA (cytosine-5-)-methyltransferase n=1 Tax=uncultured Porphyromonas sp. TaxID=159274 RepID=UPI0025EA5CF5|nr:DNA (cytosine-5-)-methyltransferase [uncultured Porphyromonas sp.]